MASAAPTKLTALGVPTSKQLAFSESLKLQMSQKSTVSKISCFTLAHPIAGLTLKAVIKALANNTNSKTTEMIFFIPSPFPTIFA
jgi:hypothetical protein